MKQQPLPLDCILQGNSLEILKTLPDSSIDLIFADPPYFMRTQGSLLRPEGSEFCGCSDSWDSFGSYEDYIHFTREWLIESKRILKPNGSLWVIGAMQCIYAIGGLMQELGFWLINDVVWHKSNPTPNFLGTRLNNAHETLLWAVKDKKSKYTFHYKTAKEIHSEIVGFEKGERKQLGSVWRIPVCSGAERLKNAKGEKIHSTQKPQNLLYRVIAISSNMGDIVLDPFGGTMTTAAMAKKLGRRYIICEQNMEYIRAGRKRLDSIAFEDSAIARASYDIKPLRVSLKELICKGFLYVGEKLYLKGSEISAKLLETGQIEILASDIPASLQSEKKFIGKIQGNIHTLAAHFRGAKAARLNGFLYWEVERGSKNQQVRDSLHKPLKQARSNRISLYEIREQYRSKITDLK